MCVVWQKRLPEGGGEGGGSLLEFRLFGVLKVLD